MIGDVYNLVLQQSLYGQFVYNIFQYRQLTSGTNPSYTDAGSLIQAFQIDVLTSLDNISVSDLAYVNIDVWNLFDPDELASDNTLVPSAGAVTPTDVLSRFMAWEFRSHRATRSIRRGYKRIAGLDESMLTNSQPTAGMVTALATAAAALSADIQWNDEPLTPTFQPVIVKRIKYTAPSGNPAYRLPESAEEMGNNYFVPVYEYLRLTTQNSRKAY